MHMIVHVHVLYMPHLHIHMDVIHVHVQQSDIEIVKAGCHPVAIAQVVEH